MALPQEQKTQDYTQPLTEGSLAVDPRAAIPAAIPGAKPIPFPGGKKAEPTEPPTQLPGVGRRRFLGELLAVATGIVLGSVVHKPVRSLLADLGSLVSGEASTVFNNQDQYGIIGEANGVEVPFSEIQRETRIDPGKAIHIGNFFELPSPADVKYIKGLPFTGNEDVYTEYTSKGVRNAIAFTDIPVGTVIRAPFPGKVSRTDTEFSDTYLGMNFIFTDEEGKTYNLLLSGARDVKWVASVPKLPITRFSNLTQWLDVEVGTPLFVIQSTELVGSPSLKGFPYPSQLRLEASFGPNGLGKDPWLPIDVFFITKGDKMATPQYRTAA